MPAGPVTNQRSAGAAESPLKPNELTTNEHQHAKNAAIKLAKCFAEQTTLSPPATPTATAHASKPERFQLAHETDELNNPFPPTRRDTKPFSLYHAARFMLVSGQAALGLRELTGHNTGSNTIIEIPDNFITGIIIGQQKLTFYELVENSIGKYAFGPDMTTNYISLPKNLSKEGHASRIESFQHSTCLTGIRWILEKVDELIKQNWPDFKISSILDAGFRIPQHRLLVDHIFPESSVTAIDCQFVLEPNSNFVTEEQIASLLKENDTYKSDYAHNHNLQNEPRDLIMVRNFECDTAGNSWGKFFQNLANPNWKAFAISCSSKAIYEIVLLPILNKNGLLDEEKYFISKGENPEAQRITFKFSEIDIENNQQVKKEASETVGPDAYYVLIVQKPRFPQ